MKRHQQSLYILGPREKCPVFGGHAEEQSEKDDGHGAGQNDGHGGGHGGRPTGNYSSVAAMYPDSFAKQSIIISRLGF